MRRVQSWLAVLASILMISTSASAWACDLSCSLRQARSDCHAATGMRRHEGQRSVNSGVDSKTMPNDSMSMGGDMDMDMGAGDTSAMAAPTYTMAGMPHTQMATERSIDKMPRVRTSGAPGHSAAHSACSHEACSEISVSASPPSRGQFVSNVVHVAVTRASNLFDLSVNILPAKFGIPPPEPLPDSSPTTEILRI